MIGLNYRTALIGAAKHGDAFYCDMDRILHWAGTNYDELKNVIWRMNKRDWVVFERSKRAMETHQLPLQKTEIVFTDLVNKLTGLKGSDYLSGSFFVSQETIKNIQNKLKNDNQGWWGEYIALLCKTEKKPHLVLCEGLDWETPDRFQNEIEKIGFEKWKAKIDHSSDEWLLRIQWLREYCSGFLENI